jgi:hypothetical protein
LGLPTSGVARVLLACCHGQQCASVATSREARDQTGQAGADYGYPNGDREIGETLGSNEQTGARFARARLRLEESIDQGQSDLLIGVGLSTGRALDVNPSVLHRFDAVRNLNQLRARVSGLRRGEVRRTSCSLFF